MTAATPTAQVAGTGTTAIYSDPAGTADRPELFGLSVLVPGVDGAVPASGLPPQVQRTGDR